MAQPTLDVSTPPDVLRETEAKRRRLVGGQLPQQHSMMQPMMSHHQHLQQQAFSLAAAPQDSYRSHMYPTLSHPSSSSTSLPYGAPVASSGLYADAQRQTRIFSYVVECALGKGSFGTVYKALDTATNRPVAIKTLKHSEADVELQMLKLLAESPCIVRLLGSFPHGKEDKVNLVLELIPDNLQRIIKHYRYGRKTHMSIMFVALYSFQLFRGLASLERHEVIHRDIKPANLLVEPNNHRLKICDFGTAMSLNNPAAHQVYVCSRFYRAPELVLSTPITSLAVDLWSGGCVLGEMLLGQAVFGGADGLDQLCKIMEILGTPTAADIHAMNPEYDASVLFREHVEAVPWIDVLGTGAPPDVRDLVKSLLQFNPAKRPRPLQVMASPVHDEVRQMAKKKGYLQHLLLTPQEVAGCPYSMQQRLTAG
eukprot:TRINITY_DN34661_c0_g1_i1.p1 TRINITY_DN34661_c0_g1~~TRINITY_DN34661_c0_g1_i1.p1  ORF type:complete len:424 (-),score=46.77 TRINITY_DN34661_c0_g1_i1:133-1404(-)